MRVEMLWSIFLKTAIPVQHQSAGLWILKLVTEDILKNCGQILEKYL